MSATIPIINSILEQSATDASDNALQYLAKAISNT